MAVKGKKRRKPNWEARGRKKVTAALLDKSETAPVAVRSGTDSPEAGILDDLLAEKKIEENGADILSSGESPDKTLQRECMLALRGPGLKPHERLKIIQTLDKVNERLSRSSSEEDVTGSLLAWIAEVMEGGPGPMSEGAP